MDAYAAQHPGVAGPQSTQSVWVHLIALQLVLEGGWPTSQLVRIRKAVGDLFPDLPWLEPPAYLGEVTFPDLDAASDGPLDDLASALGRRRLGRLGDPSRRGPGRRPTELVGALD